MRHSNQHKTILASYVALALGTTSCTGQLPGSFRYTQQDQKFASNQKVDTKIDLLWVVDNSASMDTSQEKIREGFGAFARKYLKPSWDIQVAVITTDTYLANPAFQSYLNTTISGTVNWRSTTVANRVAQNGSYDGTSLVDVSTGRFSSGIKYKDIVTNWGPDWARLLPGNHDGPITTLCSELLPYFLRGVPLCTVRDSATANRGISNCVSPNVTSGEKAETQCVNTRTNNTIHSGKPIIRTMPPTGVDGDSAWVDSLIQDFLVNVSVGSSGNGSERGLGSVLQLIQDNEPTSTAFFRPDSLRGIIFVSDEEDQTLALANPSPTSLTPLSYYKCDLQSYQDLNPGDSRVNTTCCASGCTYKYTGTGCPAKTIDGFTYRVSTCPSTEQPLVAVSTVKTQLDEFFRTLDGALAADTSKDPNYFTVAIVPLTGQAVQDLQGNRNTEDDQVGILKNWAVDRGDRYLELGNLVGNGSLSMNLADSDYSPILDAIGRSLVQKKGTFTLNFEPAGADEMTVRILHADGTSTTLSPSQFQVTGKTLQITDMDAILAFAATDQVSINYQPKNLK